MPRWLNACAAPMQPVELRRSRQSPAGEPARRATRHRWRTLLEPFRFELAESVHAEARLFCRSAFLDDIGAAQVDFLVGIFRDDVVPLGEAGVQCRHATLRLF